MNYTGPRVKLSRRLGVPLTPKAVKVMIHKPLPPGQHGGRRRRALSDYGKQLLEKQKLKSQYNVNERQLRNYYKSAKQLKGNTGENLIALLESRLDAVVLRAGLTPTIYSARQLVRHGHVTVNDKKIDLPSYRVAVSDVVSVKEKSRAIPCVQEALQTAVVPAYIELNKANFAGRLVKIPAREEVPVQCDIPLVVEFYSR
ncbi:MAG: 30S ribosomal protein S4 [Bdellovibrionales bacterium]|nr:30S ribosomal protein S4 [Bdellovibrionales bacterium]